MPVHHSSLLGVTIIGVLLCSGDVFAQFPDKDGYLAIFNGRDLTGWTMQWEGLWTVADRTLTGKQDPKVGKDSWLFTEAEWDDFCLLLEFRDTKGGNSGVGIRMPAGVEGRPSQHGYEIQISDVDEEFPTGSVFRHVKTSRKLDQPDQWNTMAITCMSDHIVVYVNKLKVVDARLEGSKKGRIGLQVHGGEQYKEQVVEFRNIKIKDLKPQYRAEKSPLVFKAHPIVETLAEGCAVADINNDGKLDISNGAFWYEAPDWTPHEYRTVPQFGEFLNDYGEIAQDVNGDGWMDIISGGWNLPILAWYENPGNDRSTGMWKEHIMADDLSGTEAIISGDVDGDGMNDVLVNRYNTSVPVAYFAFVGLDKSPNGFERRILGTEGRGHGMGFGDLNGDGRGDVLTPHGWYAAPENPKNVPWPWNGVDQFDAEESSVPFVVDDFNQDGKNDFAWGHAHSFGLFWMEQARDSAGRMGWLKHTIDPTWSQVHCPVLADLDGDGVNDIIAGKRYRGHAGSDPGAFEPLCIFWYRLKPGPDPQWTKIIVSYDENIGAGMNLTVIDLDGDGDMDIVAPGKTGLFWLEQVKP